MGSRVMGTPCRWRRRPCTRSSRRAATRARGRRRAATPPRLQRRCRAVQGRCRGGAGAVQGRCRGATVRRQCGGSAEALQTWREQAGRARGLRAEVEPLPGAGGIGHVHPGAARAAVQRALLPEGIGAALVGGPWERGGEGVEEVPQRPRDDDVVVERDEEGHQHTGHPDAGQGRVDLPPRLQRAHLELLPDAQLQEEERHADDHQHDRVRHEEGATAVLVAQVGEAPEVAQPDCVADTRYQELEWTTPPLPRGCGHFLGRIDRQVLKRGAGERDRVSVLLDERCAALPRRGGRGRGCGTFAAIRERRRKLHGLRRWLPRRLVPHARPRPQAVGPTPTANLLVRRQHGA